MKRPLVFVAIILSAIFAVIAVRATRTPHADGRPIEDRPAEAPRMGFRLLTVESCVTTDQGLAVLPAVPMRSLSGRPEMRRLQQGSCVELRLSDGTRRETRIATYGVPVDRGEDGQILVRGGPDGPEFEVHFTLSADLRPEDVPAGTEVWYFGEPDG